MDPGIEKLFEEWRLLDDQMRLAEAARPRWFTLQGALNSLVLADPSLFPEEFLRELRAPFGSTPRQEAMEGPSTGTHRASAGQTNAPSATPAKVQMWPLAQRILAEKGPMKLPELHKELVLNGWKQTFAVQDRRNLYNTLTAMPHRFVKIDDKWANNPTASNE